MIPAEEGSLGAMLDEVVTQMIHPDGREEFLEFWSLDRMAACLQGRGGGPYP